MSRRTLTDAHRGRIADPVSGRVGDRGVTGKDDRLFADAVLWIARTGAPWRDLGDAVRPERAAHVHRRLPDHAADLPEDQRPGPRVAGGLAWAFIIGVIVPIGAFVGPTIRRYTPRAAMLGTLAGISIGFILMRPVFQMWELPWIAFVAFAISLIGWTANVRLPRGLPGGLVAVTVGTVLAWLAVLLGWTGYMEPSAVGQSLRQFGLRLPIPSGDAIARAVSPRAA